MAKAAGTTLSPSQKLAWLRLIRTDNVGPVTFRQLLNRTGSAEAAIADLPRLAKRVGVGAKVPSIAEAEDEIAALEKLGGRLIGSGEADYPPLLAHISAAPPLLSVIGGKDLDLPHTVAIVGARNASSAGQRMTALLANKASLTTGTVAILAGGLDRIYPEENAPLAQAIIDNGGMLLTEMPMGWEPRAKDFPRRNRLVSGLSLGVVVVEAAKRSGSLITARLALEQNRDVFAVPGSPLDPRAEGGNHLIQEGARLVTSAADIIESLATADPSRSMLFEPDWQPDTLPLTETEPTTDDRDSNPAARARYWRPDRVVQRPIGGAQGLTLIFLPLKGKVKSSHFRRLTHGGRSTIFRRD